MLSGGPARAGLTANGKGSWFTGDAGLTAINLFTEKKSWKQVRERIYEKKTKKSRERKVRCHKCKMKAPVYAQAEAEIRKKKKGILRNGS